MTITARDMTDHVNQALDAGYGGADFDQDAREAIVRALIDRYGLINLDAIPHDEFWAVVEAHEPDLKPRTYHSDALGAVTIPEDDDNRPYHGTAPIERGPFPGMIWP